MTRLTAALVLLAWAPAALAKEKLVVLPLTAEGALEKQASAAGELVLIELQKDGRYEVLGSSDLQTLLGIERQKQLLGCSDESGGCMTELSGALGAPFVLTGTLTRVAEGLRVDLKLMQADKATVLAREGGIAATDGELLATTSRILSDLLLQLPGAKTSFAAKRLPWVTGGIGAIGALVGLVLLGDQGLQAGRLQGQLNAHEISAPAATTTIGGIYRERAAGVMLVTLGSLIAVASLVWWWLR